MIGREDSFRKEIVISSMNKQPHPVFADPQFAIEHRDIVDFLTEFGPFNGRYVPRYPYDWPKRLREHVESFGLLMPVKRQAMLERIRREAVLCTEPVKWQWNEEKSWSENIKENARGNHNPIIVGSALDPTPFLSWGEVLDDIRNTRQRSWLFSGEIATYVKACLPLLVNSPSAYIVDPFLDPFSNRAENLVRSLFSKVKGISGYAIELITRVNSCSSTSKIWNSSPISLFDIEKSLDKIYKPFVPKGNSLKLHLVFEGREAGAFKLHDRFFITKYGALSFGQGFQSTTSDLNLNPVNAFVVDREHHALLIHTYINGVARYTETLPKRQGDVYPNGVNSFVIENVG